MKRFLFAALLLFSTAAFAQQFKFPKRFSCNAVGIPGTQMMIDQCEVSVSDWFAFVYSQYYDLTWKELKEGVETVMPDTTKMPAKYLDAVRMFRRLQNAGLNDDFVMLPYYGKTTRVKFEMPELYSEKMNWKTNLPLDSLTFLDRVGKLMNLPMVGISYAQVQQYLAWREKLANNYDEVKKSGYKVRARLMTPEEWAQLQTKIGPRKEENNSAQIDTMNAKGCYLLNVRVVQPCANYEEGVRLYGTGAVPVDAYFPDRLGLYSIYGNVWEMTSKEGVAIGGGWNDFAIRCGANKEMNYTGPEEYLGFRCVLEFYK